MDGWLTPFCRCCCCCCCCSMRACIWSAPHTGRGRVFPLGGRFARLGHLPCRKRQCHHTLLLPTDLLPVSQWPEYRQNNHSYLRPSLGATAGSGDCELGLGPAQDRAKGFFVSATHRENTHFLCLFPLYLPLSAPLWGCLGGMVIWLCGSFAMSNHNPFGSHVAG